MQYKLSAFALILLLSACGTSRPGDTSEGIPGYLVDPSNISVTLSGNNVSFSAPAGTVVSENSDLILAFWTPTSAQITSLAESAESGSADLTEVTLLGTITPSEDGSISVTVSADNPQANLAITLTTSASTTSVTTVTAAENRPTFVHKSFSEGSDFTTASKN